MKPLRLTAALATACALTLSLSGCFGGQGDPATDVGKPALSGETHTEQPTEAGGEGAERAAKTGVQIGDTETTGVAWPADWPAELPRVGGELWAANADSAEGVYSVVGLVADGVISSLIDEFKSQGYSAENESSSGDNYGVTLLNRSWRVDIIGVINEESGKPHLRYLAQRE